jgi:hypothetical protein
MVTVIGYNSRKNKSGENFITLELTGSLEIVQSQNTGKMYATVKKCSIPSTFDEQIAKMMIGSKIDGEIVRVPCDPYDYIVKSTGEQITLAYSYAYQPAGSKELVGHGFVELDNQRESGKPAQGNGANTGDAARLLASSK